MTADTGTTQSERRWICSECAAARGSRVPDGHLPTWHVDTCDWCRQEKAVTEPRDFRPRPDR